MAKKFKFRLEPILRLREYSAEQAKQSLAQIIKLKIDCENKILALSDDLENSFKVEYASNTVYYMQTINHYRENIKLEIGQINKKIDQLVEIENVRRKILAEKMKEQKIFEKLKDKDKIKYKFEVDKEEQKFIDEIAVTRFQLKSDFRSEKLRLT